MNKMTNNNRRVALLGMINLILILIIGLPSYVYASEYSSTDHHLNLSVQQTFTNSANSTVDDVFLYRLEALETGNPMPQAISSLGTTGYFFTLAGNSSLDIELQGFDHPGVYHYLLSQVVNEYRHGYTYDERVYSIAAYVDSALTVGLVVLDSDGNKVDSIEYQNKYQLAATDQNKMLDPLIVKTVEGNPTVDSSFSFRLEAADRSYPMPEGSLDGVKTIHINGSGQASFGSWSYQTAGVYIYTVYEVNTQVEGYIYDPEVYTITDTVYTDGSQLLLSRTMTNTMNKRVLSFSFVNQFTAGSVDHNKPGSPANPSTSVDGPKYGPKTGDNLDLGNTLAQLIIGILLTLGTSGYLLISYRSYAKQKCVG